MTVIQLAEKICKGLGIPFVYANPNAYGLYSAIARQTLASFWEAGNGGVSTVHLKNTIRRLLYAFVVLTKDYEGMSLKKLLDGKDENSLYVFADELVELFWQTGNIYRMSNKNKHQFSAVMRTSCNCGSVQFLRGVSVEESVFMSGCGMYTNCVQNIETDISTVVQFWGLGEPIGMEFLVKLAAELDWFDFNQMANVEYLDAQWQKGTYWKNEMVRDVSGQLSLARYGNKGQETYVLYRKEGDRFRMAKLPKWRSQHPWGDDVESQFTTKEYNRIACSILKCRGCLPPIRYKIHGKFVFITLGYLLPTAEENLFRLYSWPRYFDGERFNSLTQRVMVREIFDAFKKILEFQGFTLNEDEKNG